MYFRSYDLCIFEVTMVQEVKDAYDPPVWTRVLPWILLLIASTGLILVLQKGCVDVSTGETESLETVAQASDFPSQGVYHLEMALINSTIEDREFILDGIVFVQASALVDPASRPALDQLGALLLKYQSVHIRLEGYCTKQQDARANLKVSHQRATSVSNYLKAKGIDASRLRTVGRGDSKRPKPAVSSAHISGQNDFIGLVVEAH